MTNAATASNWTAFHTTEKARSEWAPGYERPQALVWSPLLDRPSEPHPILNGLMDEALTRIMLVSDGAVMALCIRITTSHASTQEPTSDLAMTIDRLGEKYMACKTHRRRLLVIKEAQDTANRLRYAPNRAAVRGTVEWREAIASDSRSCRVLAGVYGVSHVTIATIKKQGVKHLANPMAVK